MLSQCNLVCCQNILTDLYYNCWLFFLVTCCSIPSFITAVFVCLDSLFVRFFERSLVEIIFIFILAVQIGLIVMFTFSTTFECCLISFLFLVLICLLLTFFVLRVAVFVPTLFVFLLCLALCRFRILLFPSLDVL